MNILESADVQDRRERDSSVEIPDSEHVVTGGNEQHLWWERAASLVCSISWTSWLGVSGLFTQHIRLTYDKLTELNDVVFVNSYWICSQNSLICCWLKWSELISALKTIFSSSVENWYKWVIGWRVEQRRAPKRNTLEVMQGRFWWLCAVEVGSRSWKPLSDCLVFDIKKSVETYRPHKDHTGLI